MNPPPIFRYVPLVFAGVALLNVLIWSRRLRRLQASGGITRADAGRFLRTVGGALVFAFLAWALLVLAAGWPDPFCMQALPLRDPLVAATYAATIVPVLLVMVWVLAFGGDQVVSRASPALTQRFPGRTWTPGFVRTFAIVVALFVTVVSAGGRLFPPTVESCTADGAGQRPGGGSTGRAVES